MDLDYRIFLLYDFKNYVWSSFFFKFAIKENTYS